MVKIHLRVKELLKENGMTQLQLSDKTKIRKAAISELCNNMRTSINKEHLEKIANAFELKDISQLIEFVED